MASVYEFTCPSCGKKFSFSYGLGFLIPDEKLLKRSAGFKETKQFVDEHPNGLVDPSMTVRKCKKCGALKNCRDFTMYLPVDENETLEHGHYFFVDQDRYEKYKDVSFRCNKCGGREGEIIDKERLSEMIEREEILCPGCGRKLGAENYDFLKAD